MQKEVVAFVMIIMGPVLTAACVGVTTVRTQRYALKEWECKMCSGKKSLRWKEQCEKYEGFEQVDMYVMEK